jgi:protein phosphatase
MRVRAASATDVGLVREANEDSAYCGRAVFAVADGLGGHAAGEVASALAVQPLAELDERGVGAPEEAGRALSAALLRANQVIMAAAQADESHRGMGTTVTAAAVTGGHLILAHAGDSRAYLLRRDEPLRQLTVDHTPAGEGLRAGYLTPEQARRHPERHILLRAVGLEPDLQVDTPAPEPLRAGDRVLLCSDGLSDAVPDEEIAALLAGDPAPDVTCAALVEAALAHGGPDNVTVVLLAVEDA